MADTYTLIPGETSDRKATKHQLGLLDTGSTINGQPVYALYTGGGASLTAPATGYAATRGSDGIERKYSTLSAALAAISDATANNRRTVVVQGTITETAPVTAKSYVDVKFEPGAILNCNGTTSGTHGILFNGATNTKWYATVPGTVEIRRNGTFAGGGNRGLEITAGSNLVFRGLVVRNLVTNINSNRGLNIAGSVQADFYDCSFYGAGTSHPYGAVADGTCKFYRCSAYGGDTTIGGAGSGVAAGWVLSSAATCNVQFFNCFGYGGNAGAGAEAYGWWIFAYGGQGSGQAFAYLEDCVGYGGTAAAYTDGINLHISATAHLKNCTGIGGNNGHGIGCYGTALNYARFLFEGCTGICRNTNASSTDWHGFSVGATDRSRFIDCKGYGSPFVAGSCGLRLVQDAAVAGSTASDTAISEFTNCTFYGGGAGMEAQTQTTQNTTCYALKVTESDVGARFNRCNFLSNDASAAIRLESTATLANLFFYGGEAYSNKPASNVAIDSANAWNPANVFGMRLLGGTTNVTPTVEYAPIETTLTDGATITWALGTDRVGLATVTLGGNRTLAITGAVAGTSGILKVVQDGTGGHTLALPATSKVANAGGGVVTLSAGAGAIDVLSFYYNGSNYFWTYGVNFT